MGGGRWDTNSYTSSTILRRSTGTSDFAYSDAVRQGNVARVVHANLDPKRINKKPFGKLESRDSAEHPESNAVLLTIDVTGSNIARAREVWEKLPTLMNLLTEYLPDPQVAIAANDDFEVEPDLCAQLSDFESDNRIDEHLRNAILVGNGGGNSGESYDLLLYAAARKTILDCMEKRSKKGYLFMYADEPFFPKVDRRQIKAVFGDDLQKDISIEQIIEEARKLYNVYLISSVAPEYGADKQYVKLFGRENVFVLQQPKLICKLIGSVIGMNEEKITPKQAEEELDRAIRFAD